MQKLKNNEPQPKFTGSYKKNRNTVTESISFPVRRKTSVTIQWGGGGGAPVVCTFIVATECVTCI